MILMKKGIKKKVIYHLKRCIEIDPNFYMSFYFQSFFYLKIDESKAEEYLKNAILLS